MLRKALSIFQSVEALGGVSKKQLGWEINRAVPLLLLGFLADLLQIVLGIFVVL